jgi:hypothetical protein
LPPLPERAQLLAHGEARAAGQGHRPAARGALFTPDAHVTWLLAALDPADGDTAWGLIDLGIGMPARDGQAVRAGRHRRAAQAARDARSLFPAPVRTLSEYVRLAQENGAIPD